MARRCLVGLLATVALLLFGMVANAEATGDVDVARYTHPQRMVPATATAIPASARWTRTMQSTTFIA